MHSTSLSSRIPGVLVVGTALLFAACASTKSGADSSPDARGVVRMTDGSGTTVMEDGTRYITTLGLPSDFVIHYPDWIINPGIDQVLGAVGVSGPSVLGTREQVEEARLAARLELARMLETRVQSVGRGELEEHRRASGDPADPDADAEGRRMKLGIDRDITDLVLSGSRQRALWFDPLSHDCYIWVVMDGGIPGKADHTVENGTSVYVANQPLGSEYRPERQPERKVREQPAPAPAPEPVLTPVERLEENLKPIEVVPVRAKPASNNG